MSSNSKDQYHNTRFTGLFKFNIVAIGASVIGMILIVLGVYLNTAKRSVITVNFNDDTCLLSGDTFELKWIHSVEKQWWVEAYQKDGDKLLLTDTYFQTFGAGTPSTEIQSRSNKIELITTNQAVETQYQARQNRLNDVYRGYIHYEINTELDDLNWMISSNIKAVIINEQTTLPIYQWVSDYTNIHISPKTLTTWALMTQESCHDYTNTNTNTPPLIDTGL